MKIVKKNILKHLVYLLKRRYTIYAHKQGITNMPTISYPHIIEIELTNDCNLKCRHCFRTDMDRQIGHMEFSVFKKLIDEIEDYSVAFLRIVGLGESALNKEFSKMIQYASNKGIKIEITTNGELFERFSNKEILSWDIDILGISVDGTDKESYEKIRIGGDYNSLNKNIEAFFKQRNTTQNKYPLIVIRKVIVPGDTQDALQKFKENWNCLSDMITFNTLSKTDSNSEFEYLPSYNCTEFYYTAHIRYDGSALLCPNKFIFNKDDVIGNIKYEDLKYIWQSEKLAEIRELHVKKDFPEFCQRCFLSFNNEKAFDNSRKHNFSNNKFQNFLDKFINIS